ncbi:Pentatricopeptide repeat-containing protein [Apostasia shenzhenica]|uniref:Pentatricopeptide repeat-containing protein n=1 Tax=Apostasia shenzhenica TaxID=1088818 RepID=A0A2I0AGZ9_9ASPA|nr:Pentatricopeptide repeat-containing protein [Apostasia shenzhenica]
MAPQPTMPAGSHLARLPAMIERFQSMAELRQMQAQLTVLGLAGDTFLVSKLLLFSAISEAGDLDYSRRLFLTISSPSNFAWNTLIRGFSRSRKPNIAVSFFIQMLRAGAQPDHLTFPFVAKSCARLASLRLAGAVHGQVFTHGYDLDLFILNSLIHMYASCGAMAAACKVFDGVPHPNMVSWNSLVDGFSKCGDLDGARKVFDEMLERDVVSWSAMIDGYVKGGEYREALALFERMQTHGPKANEVTMISVLCACAHLGILNRGRQMHQYIKDNGLNLNLAISTSLIDMYAKSGSLEESIQVFRSFPVAKTDVLIWNAVIGGLATLGKAREAVEMFREMITIPIKPDEITFLELLSACAHGGFVREAWEFFQLIQTMGMNPHVEHYASMVDVLGRAGCVEEAYELVRRMPMEPSASVLGALLSACLTHGKVELGEIVGKRLVNLEPEHDGRYVGLSNVFATAHRWEDAKKMREEMDKRGVTKAPGQSEIEVNGALHKFIAHDKSHPQSIEVYWMLNYVTKQMKMEFDSFIV